MILTWFHRWKRGTKAQALVSAYRDLPAEHRETATYTTFEDGTYKVWVLTAERVPAFAAQYAALTAGQPAVSPELD